MLHRLMTQVWENEPMLHTPAGHHKEQTNLLQRTQSTPGAETLLPGNFRNTCASSHVNICKPERHK